MKSKKTDKESVTETNYPCLMVGESGIVVLMSEYETGTVVHRGTLHPEGHYSKTWHMPAFKPFTGTIELSNE